MHAQPRTSAVGLTGLRGMDCPNPGSLAGLGYRVIVRDDPPERLDPLRTP